jgi:hypothetical protein
MKYTIALKINLGKIDTSKIYVAEKTGAKYLDAVLLFNTEDDQYNNNGMIVQQVSKEERQSGVRGEILGNAKILSAPPTSVRSATHDDDLSFLK